jgi:salicylate hydroxylase
MDMLLDLARPYMILRLDSRVIAVDPQEGKVTLENGDVILADLIVGADGIKIRARRCRRWPTKPSCADRACRISRRYFNQGYDFRSHSQATGESNRGEKTGWMGPGKHIMAYCIVLIFPS